MKKTRLFILIPGVFALIAMSSCKKDNSQDLGKISISQSDLDKVTNHIYDTTGGFFSHGAPTGVSPDSTIRMIYSSETNLKSIPVGTIIAKRTFHRGPDGKKTDEMYGTFVVVKQNSGYNAAGGDLEYINIPYDASNDYSAHPNGILPADGATRGKLETCMGCHSGAGGNDFIFSND